VTFVRPEVESIVRVVPSYIESNSDVIGGVHVIVEAFVVLAVLFLFIFFVN